MTLMPDTAAASSEVTEVGLQIEATLKRLVMLQSQNILRDATLNMGADEAGNIRPTTSTATLIIGMLDASISLAVWLTNYLYTYENKTFDEGTTIALTTARRAQAAVETLNDSAIGLQQELTHLIANNRMRIQGIEYLNSLQEVIELANEIMSEQQEEES